MQSFKPALPVTLPSLYIQFLWCSVLRHPYILLLFGKCFFILILYISLLKYSHSFHVAREVLLLPLLGRCFAMADLHDLVFALAVYSHLRFQSFHVQVTAMQPLYRQLYEPQLVFKRIYLVSESQQTLYVRMAQTRPQSVYILNSPAPAFQAFLGIELSYFSFCLPNLASRSHAY